MPVETCPDGNLEDRRKYTHLEAVARLLVGIAPWLEVELPEGEEKVLQANLRELARASIDAISDPASPDFANWDKDSQPLVDAAFLAHALLRSPVQLWERLDARVRDNVVAAMMRTRTIVPGLNNWVLFLAMVDSFLLKQGQKIASTAIYNAVELHEQWYKGDGVYGDGREFHWDYYNSFVIHPMLVDIVDVLVDMKGADERVRQRVVLRATRYAAIQERLIAPDGTFPPIGRSLCYRGGAFQLLAQMALQHRLPEDLSPAQVRCALTAMLRRTLDVPGTFTEDGWLRLGLAGHQPSLGEKYISTGSTYLCSTALLPLGLPPADPFWSAPDMPYTSQRAWGGEDIARDHAHIEWH